MNRQSTGRERTEMAPDHWNRSHQTGGPISVILKPNESVEWTWTASGNGERYISGCVIKKEPKTFGYYANRGTV